MYFGKNSNTKIEVPKKPNLFDPNIRSNTSITDYKFHEVKLLNEKEATIYYKKMFNYYKASLKSSNNGNINGLFRNIQRPTPVAPPTPSPWLTGTLTATGISTGLTSNMVSGPIAGLATGVGSGPTMGPSSSKYSCSEPEPVPMPLIDLYIIPKLFEYFPMLDCDGETSYSDCTTLLDMNDIGWTSYQSSAGKYWIMCDKELDIDDAIDFIHSYPADVAYGWCAEHKKELCIRAVPKNNTLPAKHEESENIKSNRFSFWTSEFENYWENSDIINYYHMMETINKI